MTRNYNFTTPKKSNKDDKVVKICICLVLICVFVTYMYCSALKHETDNLRADELANTPVETDTESVSSDSIEELSSSIGTMITAGNACADMQNEMITENDEYLLEVKNATEAGYYQRIIMSERYRELLDTFNKKYMRDVPSGASTVMWSEYGVWEFNADYDYAAELNATMPAVWACYAKEDTEKLHPYAFVTATYVTASEQFIEPKLSKTEWYPTRSDLYGSVEDGEEIVNDQCNDSDSIAGGNEEANMTQEQLEAWAELQKLMAGEAVKEEAVSISH